MRKWPIKWDLRTSITHPIKVDWIKHRKIPGLIGITFCPGKYQPVSWSGGWNRNLDIDIDALAETDVSTIISLIDEQEIVELRVQGLGETIQKKKGIEWIHLPFEDTTFPNKSWFRKFNRHLEKIAEQIVNGESTIIHCKGGLGRAGTVSCILMNYFGIEMDDAIKLVRKTRSQNCINPTQEKISDC